MYLFSSHRFCCHQRATTSTAVAFSCQCPFTFVWALTPGACSYHSSTKVDFGTCSRLTSGPAMHLLPSCETCCVSLCLPHPLHKCLLDLVSSRDCWATSYGKESFPISPLPLAYNGQCFKAKPKALLFGKAVLCQERSSSCRKVTVCVPALFLCLFLHSVSSVSITLGYQGQFSMRFFFF